MARRKAPEAQAELDGAPPLTEPGAERDVLSVLAHELRAPLASIKVWATLLGRGKLGPAESTRAIDSILAAIADQERVIERLRGMASVIHVAEQEPSQQEADEEEGMRHDSTPLATLSGTTVLLAADDADTLLALQIMLEEAGAHVLPAKSGKAALALAEGAETPDARLVLVIDLSMPRMSGYQLLKELGVRRRQLKKPLIPACAVSARARLSDRERALAAGFDLFLAKPFTPQQLIDAVASLSPVGSRSSRL